VLGPGGLSAVWAGTATGFAISNVRAINVLPQRNISALLKCIVTRWIQAGIML
jgi:hypothetical protein